MSRTLKWVGWVVVALLLLTAGIASLLDASHLRGAVTRLVMEKTGRQLAINGDLQWRLDWPLLRVHAIDVAFANPRWAREKLMIAAPAVELSVDLPLLLRGTVFLPEVKLDRPVVFFEVAADGRKNWLLDPEQRNEGARAFIGLLELDHGRAGYDDPSRKTSIVVEISTRDVGPATGLAGGPIPGIVFSASGRYQGLALAASGTGAAVLEMRDERTPYPLTVVATVGPTSIRAEGTVSSLIKRSAVDVHLALRGGSLAELFDVLDIALPETRAYSLAGRLTRGADGWRYERFSGRIGQSDVAGSLHLASGPSRRLLKGDLAFKSLNLADLGPVVGTDAVSPVRQPGAAASSAAKRNEGSGSRSLPAIPFRPDRWTTVDADVQLKAETILRAKSLPLERLSAHMRMRDSVLTLDPLDFGVAGGNLVGVVRLDGQQNPIAAHVRMSVRKLLLAKLLPTVPGAQHSVGEINGGIEFVGHGDSIARILATADGKVGLVVDGGKVSKALMLQVAAHLPEVLLQRITGDELIDVRCGVANFSVEHGTMKVEALVLDTDVTNVVGTGSLDLANETLDLTLISKSKRLSLFALRGPISVRGDLAHPELAVDTGRMAARGLAALALAAINPALALVALADPGSATEGNCSVPTEQARAPWRKTASAEKHASVPAPSGN